MRATDCGLREELTLKTGTLTESATTEQEIAVSTSLKRKPSRATLCHTKFCVLLLFWWGEGGGGSSTHTWCILVLCLLNQHRRLESVSGLHAKWRAFLGLQTFGQLQARCGRGVGVCQNGRITREYRQQLKSFANTGGSWHFCDTSELVTVRPPL